MKKKDGLRTLLVFLLPSTFLMAVLDLYFPNTGLGIMFTIPATYFLNVIICGIGIVLGRFIKGKRMIPVWVVAVLISFIITIRLYPQEYEAPVYQRILDFI